MGSVENVKYVELDLLNKAECTRLKLGQVSKALDTTESAFSNHPPLEYLLFDVPDLKVTKFLRLRWRASLAIDVLDAIRQHRAYTIDGDAVILIADVEKSLPYWRRRKEAMIQRFLASVNSAIWLVTSKEHKKRNEEFAGKFAEALKSSGVAAQVPEMLEIRRLCTAPEKQGLGYASALVGILIAKADAEGRKAFLYTMHSTTTFYAQFGFVTQVEFNLGQDNETWTKEPVTVSIMVREPQGKLKI